MKKAKHFLPSDRNQAFLLPPDLNDWLPENHLARFIAEIVDSLNLDGIYRSYKGKGGSPAYDPRILLSLLFYGYATGVYSSRKIERACYDSIAFRYLSNNTQPDHDTIATFRRRFMKELETLFVEILLIAKEAGVLRIGTIHLDGTKVKANASKHKALSYGHARRLERQLKEEIAALMQKAEEADGKEEDDGMNLPEEIARRQERLEAIRQAKEKIEERARERYEEEKKIYEEKRARREQQRKAGKKPRGKEPKAPDPTPQEGDQVNLTDEESRIMYLSGGGYGQCYNAQAAVDDASHLIVHQHVTTQTNDKQEVAPTLRWFEAHPEFKPHSFVGDNGFFSQHNVEICEAHHITPYLSMGREKHHPTLEERQAGPDPLPEDPTPVDRMRHRLQTQEGKKIYAKRKGTVEPVFGIIKQVMGFRQFLHRGLQKVQQEWNLVCIAYNLKRLHRLMG